MTQKVYTCAYSLPSTSSFPNCCSATILSRFRIYPAVEQTEQLITFGRDTVPLRAFKNKFKDTKPNTGHLDFLIGVDALGLRYFINTERQNNTAQHYFATTPEFTAAVFAKYLHKQVANSRVFPRLMAAASNATDVTMHSGNAGWINLLSKYQRKAGVNITRSPYYMGAHNTRCQGWMLLVDVDRDAERALWLSKVNDRVRYQARTMLDWYEKEYGTNPKTPESQPKLDPAAAWRRT